MFINTIRAKSNRPRTKTKIKNLYLAGDFVKNVIDLPTVSAPLEAAAQILSDHGETEGLPVVQIPPE